MALVRRSCACTEDIRRVDVQIVPLLNATSKTRVPTCLLQGIEFEMFHVGREQVMRIQMLHYNTSRVMQLQHALAFSVPIANALAQAVVPPMA